MYVNTNISNLDNLLNLFKSSNDVDTTGMTISSISTIAGEQNTKAILVKDDNTYTVKYNRIDISTLINKFFKSDNVEYYNLGGNTKDHVVSYLVKMLSLINEDINFKVVSDNGEHIVTITPGNSNPVFTGNATITLRPAELTIPSFTYVYPEGN